MITQTSLGRSILTSIFTTALDFGTLMGLVELFHVEYVVATFLGTIVGFISNFLINRQWSFEATRGAMHWQFVRVLPVQAGSSALQTFGVFAFTQYGGFQYWTSKIIVATLVYLLWNYPMNRFWVFRRKIEATEGAPGR